MKLSVVYFVFLTFCSGTFIVAISDFFLQIDEDAKINEVYSLCLQEFGLPSLPTNQLSLMCFYSSDPVVRVGQEESDRTVQTPLQAARLVPAARYLGKWRKISNYVLSDLSVSTREAP